MQLSVRDARGEGLAGTEDVLLPDKLTQGARPHAVRERSQRVGGVQVRRAHRDSGAGAPLAARRADDVDIFWRRKAHLGRGDRRIAGDLLEDDGRGLPELVFHDHALELVLGEAEKRAAKVRVRGARLDQHPAEAGALARRGYLEILT